MIDAAARKNKKIPIITVHQAKGCEFDYVFIAGCNEKLFPLHGIAKGRQGEEEARIFYVALSRAKKQLFLSGNKYGLSQYVSKIPSEYLLSV